MRVRALASERAKSPSGPKLDSPGFAKKNGLFLFFFLQLAVCVLRRAPQVARVAEWHRHDPTAEADGEASTLGYDVLSQIRWSVRLCVCVCACVCVCV